ncbi:hypothetical protein GCM10023170_017240 [Phytohabitans houttuyneae]|uniref:Uncharacterized protein n=1 Tax=Phytohabitans houttuyneae TaxID=1076126 RepID=A0A6V8KPR7_9ACTN|nr:hypothetical protein Phou_100240 [Phytohabitans houttuyneae]
MKQEQMGVFGSFEVVVELRPVQAERVAVVPPRGLGLEVWISRRRAVPTIAMVGLPAYRMIGVSGRALTGRRRSSTVLTPDRMALANRGRTDSKSVLEVVTVGGLPSRSQRQVRGIRSGLDRSRCWS